MRKRELLTGFGAGILVATAIIGLTAPKPVSVSAPGAMTEDQIKEAAKAMEMVVLNKEEYEQWQGEKKVNVKPAATPPSSPAKPEVNQVTPPQVNNVETPSVPESEASSPVEVPAAQSVTETAPPQVADAPTAPQTASFTVPYKATAEKVAQILVAENILPADNSFVDELRSQNKLNRIRVGTYELSVPATEEEIVKLITTPPKR